MSTTLREHTRGIQVSYYNILSVNIPGHDNKANFILYLEHTGLILMWQCIMLCVNIPQGSDSVMQVLHYFTPPNALTVYVLH